ncbi:MAG TPA: sugar transferase [Terriglobales bacterium]|jgi:lipopolysaccharide/colanic/teichoic acid biosynthesis glycosyltransferase|nr:sugar transferase [Terriglobales bacterium]
MSPLAEESSAAGMRMRGILEDAPETMRNSRGGARLAAASASVCWDRCVLDEESFHRAIALERRRTERSRKPFLLMLLDIGDCLPEIGREEISSEVLGLLSLATRETDVSGWYESNVVGVMFTEITLEDRGAILQVMMDRVSESLRDNLSQEQFHKIRVTVHLFPDEWKKELPHSPCDPKLYPDLERRKQTKRIFGMIKRAMDLMGAGAAVIALAPVFLVLAAIIKLTSKGPVFFRQQRVGQFGNRFMLLKLRSMFVGNDPSIHQEYVKKLIAAGAEDKKAGRTGVYKLTNDPRITRIGAFIRKTSLDEIPQFVNVLKGEMSLVGPRPPIAYEIEAYDLWHRRRVLEAKPGITGLWQVNGRSRVTFDEMVRLDLQYASTWTPWMDLKILLRTPGAVVNGDGAY